MYVTANLTRRWRWVQTRPDGLFTKWDFMSPAQMQRLSKIPFLKCEWDPETGKERVVPGSCGQCGHPTPTEAEFAKHFVIPDLRYLGLGYCPNKPHA